MNILSYIGGPHNINPSYGWFHVYSFTMFAGIAVAIALSWYKLYRHKIPTDGMALSIIFIIPASLLGASFLGKDDPNNPMSFWSKLEFWNGGLSIHGGVLFGVLMGLITFGFVSRKTKVSLWTYADCIIPNILIGQVIGRWGNFFNHELLGQIVGYSSTQDASNISAISWLPAFIRDNCFKLVDGSAETIFLNGQSVFVYRAPIFLYESMANLGLWLILTFLVPKLFLWSNKNKPWKRYKDKYQLLRFKNDKNYNFFKVLINNYKVKKQAWSEEFYDKKADELLIENIDDKYYQDLKQNNKFIAYIKRSKSYYQINNSNNYIVMNTGVQTWLYFFGWNFIRFFLETQRTNPADLFIINRRVLDYSVLISLFCISLVIAILSQFVFPKLFRNKNWTYEKQY